MPKISILIMLFIFTFAVHATQTLRLNTTTKWPLHSAEHTGFLDKLVGQMLQEIGYNLETVELPAERGLINVNAGLEDGEMNRVGGIENLYPNLIPIPGKLMDIEFIVFSRLPIDLNKGWSSLENKTVAFLNGWKILELNVPESAEITKVKNPDQLFNLLKNGRTDYIIYIRWGGLYLLDKMGMKDVVLHQPPLAKKEMFMYLHKKHKRLVPGLAKALASMKADGTYDKLVEKHLSPVSTQPKK